MSEREVDIVPETDDDAELERIRKTYEYSVGRREATAAAQRVVLQLGNEALAQATEKGDAQKVMIITNLTLVVTEKIGRSEIELKTGKLSG
ncbi:MAG: hypothetical protein PVJ52_00690 [Candidatus Woesebacteria bacterium]|jgi:hypothetical protein